MNFVFIPPSILTVAESDTQGVYASFQVHPKTVENILAWSKKAGIRNRMNDPKSMHLTTVYSRKPFDFDPLGQYPLKARFYGYDVFGDNKSTLVAKVASPFLQRLFYQRRQNGMEWDYPDFKPHISLGKGFSEDEIDDLPPMDFACHLTHEISEPLIEDANTNKDEEANASIMAEARVKAFLRLNAARLKLSRESVPVKRRMRMHSTF